MSKSGAPIDQQLLDSGIAIVGMSGRFPGAGDVRQFWRNLCAGAESITRFNEAELEDSFGPNVRNAPNFVKARPILEDVDQFDADFFGMYAKESELTDPQHRVFLECAWEALEDAGYDPGRYAGPIGVFAGCSINTYFLQHVCSDRRTLEQFTSSYQVGCYPMLLGAGLDFLATRVSYKLNLRGPSVDVQSACSTSLLAVTQACQSLLLYQSDMALAGGVSITFPQKRGYQHLEGGMVSADGTCRPFDASATGTIFGSGSGVVLLKRLADALNDGDHIYAVVRGFGVNNDGATKVGFTAPSVDGQAAAIEMAHANAGIDARSISYVECHGTATPLGDPIEVAGLTKAFRASTADLQFCKLGSVKGNIGHLDAAAGAAGLIKTALALSNELLPASLHYRNPNPHIDFGSTPFQVNAKAESWERTSVPRRAGVSAFGVGGTNVHLVLEEAPRRDASPAQDKRPELIVLSARTENALTAMRSRLATHLQQNPGISLSDMAHTLQEGRREFAHRSYVVAKNAAEATEKLAASATPTSRSQPSTSTKIAFLFPGQGSQYLDMARDLHEREPVFRDAVHRCTELASRLMGEDLAALIYPAAPTAEGSTRLTDTAIAQPAIFTIEYALAQLWMSWGIQPSAMAGHSIGEFVAAVLAGVMSLDDAMAIVVARGRLMQAQPRGSMLAVRLPEGEVRPLLAPELSIAAINGPALCVASGPDAAIRLLEQTLQARGAVCRSLHTSHAFHSAMMDPVIAPLREQLSGIRLSRPSVPFVSCVTGEWIRDEEAISPDYWAQHARATVRFSAAVSTLAGAAPASLLLEVGPGNVLTTLSQQVLKGKGHSVVTSLQDATRERDDQDCMLDALGRLWLAGVTPDWRSVRSIPARRAPLPTYPFERKRYWIEAPDSAQLSINTDITDDSATPAVCVPSHVVLQDDRPMNTDPMDAHRATLRATIASILEELSGEKPPTTDGGITFLEMGFDSLFLTQVAQKIQSQLKVKVTFRQLLGDFATIESLATHLAEKIPAPPAAAVTAAPTPASVGNSAPPPPAAFATGAHPHTALFSQQLQAMTQLINRQMEVLGAAPVALPAVVIPAAGASTAPAPTEATESTTDDRPSRFQVYKATQKSGATGLSPEHRRHIDDLIARYTRKTPGSKRYTEEHRQVLADPRAAAGFRNEWKEMVYPIVCPRSAGSKLWDVDGNEYIDLVNGYGQTFFGHSPDFVVAAIKEQLDKGFPIGPQAEFAGKVAKLFAEITGNERVTFCNTGSEAVMAAMRIARTVTGRSKVAIFNGDYHGQFDEVLVKGVQKPGATPRSVPVAPGIPGSAVENMVVLEYATPATLQWLKENVEDLAAVIVEPVQSRHPALRPWDFLKQVREITAQAGTAFVIDEVVTGFRVHPGGIQAVAGVRADMVTYGKIVGGGMPIGILAGNQQYMDALDGGQWSYGDDSYPTVGVTFFAGTFVRHPLTLAAAWAVLQHIQREGPALQEKLAARTAVLVARLQELFNRHNVASQLESYSSWFYFHMHGEHSLASLLFHHLRLRGIHIHDGFPCFLTTAHSDEDLERIHEAFRESLEELHAAGIIGHSAQQAKPASASNYLKTDGADISLSGIPLTESQTEIWLAAQMGDEASCAFNESVTLRLDGQLNVQALEESLSRIFARHDALRATFSATGEEMRITPACAISLPLLDLSSGSSPGLAELCERDACTPFDLVNGPSARLHFVRLATNSHALVFTAHHIICDGWSINIIVNELVEIYTALCSGQIPELPQAMRFSSYSRELAQRDSAEVAATEAYWLKQYADPVRPLNLPTDRPRPSRKSYLGSSRCRRIDASLYQALKKSGAKAGNTLFVTLLGAFQALVGRLSDQDEVVVGVPTAGQSLLEDRILVGHGVNFLPIRSSWTSDTGMSKHLKDTGRQMLDAYEHQNYTLGTLVRKLALPREPGRVPLAEVQFNLERLADRISLPGLTIDVEPNAKTAVNFDLFLNIIESADGLRFDCDYNSDIFDAGTVDLWLDCYQTLLEGIVAEPHATVSCIGYLPTAERQRLLISANATAAEYPSDRCIHQLFEDRVREKPQAVAAQSGTQSVTYEALNRRANQLANLLLKRLENAAATEPRLVAICTGRSLDMLVALLATLKAGCTYVPLDATHPAGRLRHILADAGVQAMITDDATPLGLLSGPVPTIDFKADAKVLAASSEAPPTVAVSPDSPAYVIYTSGSTGKPKGVAVTHKSVVNFLTSMAREPGLAASDVLVAVTTISFDIAGLELYLPLSVGGRTVIASREEATDGYALLDLMKKTGATVMQGTPASWRLLLEAGFRADGNFRMFCGGEALPRELANRLLEGKGELWNLYGPTETTIWSSCCKVEASDAPITVGHPIANTQFYVLDRHDQPVPAGVTGQLHIGGDGVAKEYFRRPELTTEKFVANPFHAGRMYRTGDQARWLASGDLQVLGRIDHQIKLRGYRIELGEIEATLSAKAKLSAVAVLLREDVPGLQRLVAYYVEPAGSGQRKPTDLEALLADEMPEYMIPTVWVRVDAMPISPNGKLDRAALPPPDALLLNTEPFRAPVTATEITLASICTEVLHLPQISADADLLRLGADSLQLFQITARASRKNLQLPARQLFEKRTISAVASWLDSNQSKAGTGGQLPNLGEFRRGTRGGSKTT